MKCPKCGYLGFEHVDRCRNCGYDFSLTDSLALPELPIRRDDAPLAPLEDLAIVDSAVAARPRGLARPSLELPLFGPPAGPPPPLDDQPLITRPSPPRPPLAVRRATPEVPRVRPEQPRSQTLDLDLDVPSLPPVAAPVADVGSAARRAAPEVREQREELEELRAPADAGLVARFVALVIDLAILAAIDALVIYFTAQICGITIDDVGVLPRGPLLAFLLVQNGGYLIAFTASGQTLGKMAARIKVVTAESRSQLDLGHAALRTFVWAILAIPAGLGFLTAVVSRDRRGLHDRFAGTRVIRALA
jgi:uncharacterized RDD family membrane protein YckC